MVRLCLRCRECTFDDAIPENRLFVTCPACRLDRIPKTGGCTHWEDIPQSPRTSVYSGRIQNKMILTSFSAVKK